MLDTHFRFNTCGLVRILWNKLQLGWYEKRNAVIIRIWRYFYTIHKQECRWCHKGLEPGGESCEEHRQHVSLSLSYLPPSNICLVLTSLWTSFVSCFVYMEDYGCCKFCVRYLDTSRGWFQFFSRDNLIDPVWSRCLYQRDMASETGTCSKPIPLDGVYGILAVLEKVLVSGFPLYPKYSLYNNVQTWN